MTPRFFTEKRPHNGLSYKEFTNLVETDIHNANPDLMDETDKDLYEYTKLNLHRSKRIHKTYKPSDELKELVNKINEKQIWMVLTEGWCGDSAQNLPYISMIAGLNKNIDLRILLRDDNLDIMDQYLTNGKSRSIPKLVVFNENGSELFQWGPRPQEAQNLVNQLKLEDVEKDKLTEKLHLWYGRNRGKSIDFEFITLFKEHLKNIDEPQEVV
jgi:hypothetical protein